MQRKQRVVDQLRFTKPTTTKFVFWYTSYIFSWVWQPILTKMMGALSVVSQLRDLASEPQNREVIVQDQGCLPGLVLFLDHQNPDVLLATLQTLRYLAELSPNISTMKNELGMMVSLENLIEREGLSVDITALAKEVFDILSAPANPVPRTPERERRKKSQFFINSTNKKAKSVTLHIQGLDSTDQRGLCEEALLKVRGVISFTFQMASKRCTVRIRSDLPTESLASAIAATKVLSAQQVVKNEAGEEVFIPLNPCGGEVPQNSALPDYLPEEEESPEREVDRAVSRTKAKEDSNGSWLNAAAGFLTKTFYW
ncbi:armadillo repeat containing 1, like isoform X1 [Etheostoma cragini]|uniref:armadillo repeat containing 1, like isoform X1 n=2 Tax=Etheostoma cragini TaxID=417921 RepID=UPI00155E5F06|nr:armadillo repeat containing 1, like isoform X1 [Etheostoma cragini]